MINPLRCDYTHHKFSVFLIHLLCTFRIIHYSEYTRSLVSFKLFRIGAEMTEVKTPIIRKKKMTFIDFYHREKESNDSFVNGIIESSLIIVKSRLNITKTLNIIIYIVTVLCLLLLI